MKILLLHNSAKFFKALIPKYFNEEALKRPAIKFKPRVYILVLITLIYNLLSLAFPILSLQVYDRIIDQEGHGTLNVLVFFTAFVILIECMLRISRAYTVGWIGAVYEHIISCNSMRHCLGSSLSNLEKKSASDYMESFNNISRLREFSSGQALSTLIDIPFIFVFLFLIFYIANWLVIVPLMLLIIFSIITASFGKKLKKASKKQEAIDRQRLGYIVETLLGIHTVKALGLEKLFIKHYKSLQEESSYCSFHMAKEMNAIAGYGMFFSQVMSISIVFFGAPMVLSGQLTMGSLIACILLSGRITSPMQKALGVWIRYQDYQIAVDNIQEIFSIPRLSKKPPKNISESTGGLNVSNLCFSYGVHEPMILNGIDLQLCKGECIAICGDHACGKTTLLQVISGLYRPQNGKVLLDNEESLCYPARTLVKHIGYMATEGIIFKGTIKDNLTAFGAISWLDVKAITHEMGIDEEIKKLPHGFLTHLENNLADPIPPGLKQSISIARALAPNPGIILFDNADKSLDKDSYHSLYKLLHRLKGKASMVIISDDLKLLKLTEKQYILDDGVLIESTSLTHVNPHEISSYQEGR